MTDRELIADIERQFPSFAIASWRALGEGWMSRALLVNERYVFRFAKNAQASADLAKEAALLPDIAARVALAVPRFELFGTRANGLSFVAYPLIAGEPLEQPVLDAATPATRARVASQLARFMDELQTLAPCTLPVTDHRREYAEDRQALQAFAAQLPSDVTRYVEKRFAEFLGEAAFFDNQPRLIHADLSPEHLLFDSVGQELTGVIDFGDLSLGDPDYEYLYLLEDLGQELTTSVMRKRGQNDLDFVLRKVGYYVTFDHVRSILGGLERGEQGFIDDGVKALVAESRAIIY